MTTSNIGLALKQALITFAGRKDRFRGNLEKLKTILDKINAQDVDLHPKFNQASFWESEHKAPVTYIDIYEDDLITMGIFILKPGMKLPLHDHPGMFGLIKVLSGRLRITSFTINQDNDSEKEKDGGFLTVEKHVDILADSLTETCVLEPDLRNLHEIESLEEPAAFLDVLSPPYESELGFGPRKCTYFKIAKQLSQNVFNLVETSQPSWFWTDAFPYTGPDLFEELNRN